MRAWHAQAIIPPVQTEGPPPEAYGRVTDPSRYESLWASADALLDALAVQYEVTCLRGEGFFDDLGERALGGVSRSVRLLPSSPEAAPLTVAFTGFPGLTVRFGRWHVESFPSCGCDACNEDPVELGDQLRQSVSDLVRGRFSERWRCYPTPSLAYSFSTRSGSTRVSLTELGRYGRPRTLVWGAWPVREPGG